MWDLFDATWDLFDATWDLSDATWDLFGATLRLYLSFPKPLDICVTQDLCEHKRTKDTFRKSDLCAHAR